MHVTDPRSQWLPGRRLTLATLVVAFCITLALAFGGTSPAGAAGPGAIGSFPAPDVASAPSASPSLLADKANHGEFRIGKTENSGSRAVGIGPVHVWNCGTSPIAIWSWDYSTGGGWRYRGTIPPFCSGPLSFNLEDGHTYALAAAYLDGTVRSLLDVRGGTTHILYWTIR